MLVFKETGNGGSTRPKRLGNKKVEREREEEKDKKARKRKLLVLKRDIRRQNLSPSSKSETLRRKLVTGESLHLVTRMIRVALPTDYYATHSDHNGCL